MFTHRVFIVSIALLLTACNRSKTVSTSNGEVKVEESGKDGKSTVTFTGKNGESMTINAEGSKLPDNYPKDVPVAAGAKIVMATSVDSGDSKGASLILEAADNPDKTVAFYKKSLADNGWKVEATMASEQMTMFSATKDTRQLVIQVGQADGKTSVTQTLGYKK